MQELLMFMYHLTPEQAAARVPLFQFWLTAFGAALLIWLDSKGVFDGYTGRRSAPKVYVISGLSRLFF